MAAAVRVLFTAQPGSGHWHPLVPLARALRAVGHEVAFAATPLACAAIGGIGLRCFRVGTDESPDEQASQRAILDLMTPAERARFHWSHLFAGSRAARALPDMLAIVHDWRPAVIVRDLAEFAGCIAAERERLPDVAVQAVAWRPWLRDAVAKPLDTLRASAGLPADPAGRRAFGQRFLATAPPSYRDPAVPYPSLTWNMRPTPFDQSGDERLPAWVGDLPARPTVYATMGTVVNRTPGILEAMLEGLRDEPITLIMTTGRNRDPATFGPVSAHVHIERYIPQSLILPHCDLVITHGGSGTVMAALSFGVPMVIVPIEADQPDNARRCLSLGVAVTVPSANCTPDRIREAVREVLTSPQYVEDARRMRDEIAGMPAPQEVVHQLERLVTGRSVRECQREPIDRASRRHRAAD